MSGAQMLRGVLLAALALTYVSLAHYTNITPGMQTLGTVLALAPVLIASGSFAWRSTHRNWLLPLFGLFCAALVIGWHAIKHDYSRIYWAEHAGTQLFLCLMFARTLQRGHEPLCSAFARMLHGELTPVVQQYTRQVTLAWAIFFGVMSATSTLLFVAAPLSVWSLFANFCTGPLIGAMFVLEYGVRRYLHPDIEHARFLDVVKIFWKAPAG